MDFGTWRRAGELTDCQPPGWHEIVCANHGAIVDLGEDHGGERTIFGAEFPLASDALHAAVALVRGQHAEAPGASTFRRALRAAIFSAEVEVPAATGPARRVLRHGLDLLESALIGRILVSSSTAVLVSHGQPEGTDLVDRSSHFGARSFERTYELRTGVGWDPAAACSNLGWARRAAPGPVVGREEELTTLWRQLRRHGRARALLTGEAGIGKTTIAAALALRVHAEGGLVLYGRWDQAGSGPYQAWREALGSYANAASTEMLRGEIVEGIDAIERLLPEVAARLGARNIPGPADPEQDRLALFDGVQEWLVRIATRRSTLLVLDDVHWADPPSRQLMAHLCSSSALDAVPLLLLATARPGETDEAASSSLLGAPPGAPDPVVRIEMTGLAPAAVATLFEAALGELLPPSDEAAEYVTALAGATAGNPLFLQNALRSLPDELDVATFPATLEATAGSLGDVVGWRLAQLPPEVRDVLRAAALLGAHFDVEALAAATRLSPFAVLELVDVARRAGLLRTSDDRHTDRTTYSFTHEVIFRSLRDTVRGRPSGSSML